MSGPKKKPLVCPDHGIALVSKSSRYGLRWSCPQEKCTVACWGGSTSTPADEKTRAARILAHEALDALWRYGYMSRGQAYRWLDQVLGRKPGSTHIGSSDIALCKRIVELATIKGGIV